MLTHMGEKGISYPRMKETLIDLKNRRSCRKYLPQQITAEELDAVLEAGTYAPTGRGLQSPCMVVVQDKGLIDKLSAMNAAIMGVSRDPFYGAPTAVIVFEDTTAHTGMQDATLVMGNLMNAAHAVGLGSCWINRAAEMFELPEGREMLASWGIADRYKGLAVCILGYPAERGEAPAKPRKADYIIRV